MRELDPSPHLPSPVTVVGAGRLGSAIAPALRGAGVDVRGPLPRGAGIGTGIVLLCVSDAAIAEVAAAVPAGALVGHCSGATGLSALRHHEAFSLHPLLTVTPGRPAAFAGAGAAVAGSTQRALEVAHGLASALGMRAVEVADEDRVAYHATASIAANFLTTIEGAAERLGATAGVDRELLVPLVRAAVDNWSRLGARAALTGPIARGDEAIVAAQRSAVAARTPELLELFDALAAATRRLAAGDGGAP